MRQLDNDELQHLVKMAVETQSEQCISALADMFFSVMLTPLPTSEKTDEVVNLTATYLHQVLLLHQAEVNPNADLQEFLPSANYIEVSEPAWSQIDLNLGE